MARFILRPIQGFIRWLIRLLISLSIRLVLQTLIWGLHFLLFVTPRLFQVAWFTILVMAASATSGVVGIRTAVDRIADEWYERTKNSLDFPTQLGPLFMRLCRITAYMTIVFGWVLLAGFTIGSLALGMTIIDLLW